MPIPATGGNILEGILARSRPSRMASSPRSLYISAKQAADIDQKLMGESIGFSLEQLMELAGLACATGLAMSYPLNSLSSRRVLVACGPGNQGGDGLVAARHLKMWNYDPWIYLPKVGKNTALKKQCEVMGIKIVDKWQETEEFLTAESATGLVMDAVFGFSFKPPLRAPFDSFLQLLSETKLPIVSVDIPSGWDVDNGMIESIPSFTPAVLISLTAPKLGVKTFKGKHWLGGRFIPPQIAKDFNIIIPEYPGCDQIVEIVPPAAEALTGEGGEGSGEVGVGR